MIDAAAEKRYKILILEDSAEDAAIDEREIKRALAPCLFLTVETKGDFAKALDDFVPDVVVSDFALPRFDGLAALRLTLEKAPFTPVIIVTGSIDEETAVRCIKAGAADYILKENIKRLSPAILNALKQKDERVRHYETQAALIESEERFRLLAENARDLVYRYEFSPRRGFTYVSPSAARITGYTPEEHYADPDLGLKLVHPDDVSVLEKTTRAPSRNAEPVTLRWVRKDGSVIWTEQRNVPIYDEAGTLTAIEGIARDITVRKTAEKALLESEERYRALFENDPAGDFITTDDGRIISCNAAFAAALGLGSAEEAQRLNFFQFCRVPRQREEFLQILSGRRRVEHFEMDMARRDGSTAYTRVNAYGDFGPGNELVRIVGFLIDETERQNLEDRLVQTQKLESLGTLAGGIAHDFNNILNIILGYCSLVEKAVAGQADVAGHVKTIGRAAERGADLVRQLLTFARKNEPTREPVRLSEVVAEVVRLARATFPGKITISDEVPASVPVVTADPNQLHQALLNLFLNARDAMSGVGALTVRGGTIDRNQLAARFPDTEGEEYAFIRVEDTGVGMDAEVKKRVFEPFFTTKGRESGTGLGLALVYGIVQKHKGFIDIESEPGAGAAFTLYLPVRRESARPSRARASASVRSAVGGGTILLAEDEDALREFAATLLKSKGYRVFATADGESALRVFFEHRSEIDLVVANLSLPKLDGGELLARIKEQESRINAVLTSGFIDPDMKIMMEKIGVTNLLQKPFTPEELLETVAVVLKE